MDTMIFPLEWLNCGSQSTAKPLSALIDNGIFPDVWKKSNIIPVHDRQIINNYRLVSLLPICDKIFEKLLYNSIFNFLLKLKQPPEASYEKDVLKNFENSQENACNFIKKEPLSQALSWELNEIFKNTFFYRTPPGNNSCASYDNNLVNSNQSGFRPFWEPKTVAEKTVALRMPPWYFTQSL